MIEGIVVMLFGTAMMFAEPARDFLVVRRPPRGLDLGPILNSAIPFAPADRALDELIAAID
ncbi:hypothetical protein U1737_04750 [Sphingomonas sp. LB3N6]|uniref:hypothetical protein n=1 Tax=Sphingomonas fucosidasi TaxID=3096164 RepID=UPI002FCA56FC